MAAVIVQMYKDSGGFVYPSGCEKAVDVSSEIFNVERVYTEIQENSNNCIDNSPAYLNCLKIKDPVLGAIWIGDTEISFTNKINVALGIGAIITLTLLVGTDIPAGNYLVATYLHGARIVGDPVLANTPLSNIPFDPAYSVTQGRLDFSSSPLVNGMYLTLTYQEF